MKGQTDLAIGNVVGSNIFNMLAVLSIPCLLSPTAVSAELLWRDYALMFLMTSLLVLFAFGILGRPQINRYEGGLLFGGWVIYLISLYTSALG